MNAQQRPVDIRDVLSRAADEATMPDVSAQAWEQAGRIRTRRRVGIAGVTLCAAIGLGAVFGPGFSGLNDEAPTVAEPSETVPLDGLSGVPSGTVTFVFVPAGQAGSPTVDDSAASPAEAAELVGTEWTLQGTIGEPTAPADVANLGGETTLGFSEEGWGIVVAECGEAGVQGGLEVDAGEFPPAEVASTDIGCEPEVQAAEDFWIAALEQGGRIHTVGDEAVLLSVSPVDPGGTADEDAATGDATGSETDEPTGGAGDPSDGEVTVAFARADTAGGTGGGPEPATPEDLLGDWTLMPESVEPEGPVEDLVAIPEARLSVTEQDQDTSDLQLEVEDCSMSSAAARLDEEGALTLEDFTGPRWPCEGAQADAINHWVTLFAGGATVHVDGDQLLVAGSTEYELAAGPQNEPPRSDGQTPTPLATGVQAALPEGWVVEPRATAGDSDVQTTACLRDPADAEQSVCNVSISVGHLEPPDESGSGQECTTEDVQVGDYDATRTRYAQGDCASEDPGTTDVWWVPDLSLSIRAAADQDVDSLLSSVAGEAGTGEISGHVARLVDTDGATVQVELLEYDGEANPDNPDVVTGDAEFTLTEETRCFTPRPSDPMINDPVPCGEAVPWLYGYRGTVTVLVNDAGEVMAMSQPFET